MILAIALSAILATAPTGSAQHGKAEVASSGNTQIVVDTIPGDSNSFEDQFESARSLAFAGRFEDAVKATTELIASYPDNADLYLLRGRVYAWMGQYSNAEQDLLHTTAIAPGYADAWSALSDLYRWWDRPEDALRAARRQLDLAPDQASAQLSLAQALMVNRNFPQARIVLQKARELGADAEVVNRLLARMARVPSPTNYEGSLSFDWDESGAGIEENLTPIATLKRQWNRGSLVLGTQALDINHQDRNDLLVEGYLDLWTGSFGSSRVVLPVEKSSPLDLDVSLELTQTVATRFEASAAWRRMLFETETVDIFGVGAGFYLGPFYLRAKLSKNQGASSNGMMGMLALRWYYQTVDDYLDVAFYRNQDEAQAGYLSGLITTGSTTVLRGQKRLDRRFGVHGGVRRQQSSGADSRFGFSLGGYYRF